MAEYSKQQIGELFDLSRPTVVTTLRACGIDSRKQMHSATEVRMFTLARWLLEMEHLSVDELRDWVAMGLVVPDESLTVEDMALRLRGTLGDGKTKQELAALFGIQVRMVAQTIAACGLSTRQRRYSPEQVEAIAQGRRLLQRFHWSYAQLATYIRQRQGPGGFETDLERVMTKRDLKQHFGVALGTVRDTLKACGLSTRQQVYGPDEVRRFGMARQLLDRGMTYRQVAERLGAGERATATVVD